MRSPNYGAAVAGLKRNSGAEAKALGAANAKAPGGAEAKAAGDALGGGAEDVRDEDSPEGGAEALEDEPTEALTPQNVFTLSFKKLVERLEAKPPKPGKPLALLVMTGAFNPPHKGHLFALEAAAAWCRRDLDLEVAGAVVSLAHDTAVRNKFKRTPAQAIPARHRLRLCQEMAKKWAWVAVDRWEVTRRAALDYLSVLEHVRQVIHPPASPTGLVVDCAMAFAHCKVQPPNPRHRIQPLAAANRRGPSRRRRSSPTCASFTSATPQT